jgi:protoporphyrinogen oxidase
MKIAIIGTGISGLSSARMLQNMGHSVTLFEKQPVMGGLIKCERVNDCLFHKVGGHVFNSRNQKVLDWFWSHFDKENEFVAARRKAKIFFKNRIIGYPIENYLYLLDKQLVEQVINELLELAKLPRKPALEYDNFESFLRSNFGNSLYEVYFAPYNHKIWRTDLSKVSMEWLDGKLPMPDLKSVILSNMMREEEAGMVHATFFYAKENGSQFIVDRLAQGLTIQTGTPVEEVYKENGLFTIAGQAGFDKVIFCGDVRQLPAEWEKLLKQNKVNTTAMQQFQSNGTSNLFCETDETDISWLYIPEPFTKAHRIIYTGNFSDSNNRGGSRKTCVVEFSGEVPYETMIAEIAKLPGNLKPISFNYEPNSYVIQDKQTRPLIASAKKVLEAEGVYLLGRFAEWEYYNMDKCIEAAFDVTSRINALS